jgi:DNA topoisomerase-1
LYTLIWERFVACQMVPAQWDATSVLITGGKDPKTPCTFRASGRVLVFDGFYKVTGVPTASDEQTLPPSREQQALAPFAPRRPAEVHQPPRGTAKPP